MPSTSILYMDSERRKSSISQAQQRRPKKHTTLIIFQIYIVIQQLQYAIK